MNNGTEVTKDNLEERIKEYQPQLKSFIRKRVDNKENAEDILQDVLYQLTKTVNTAMNPIEHLAAWLYRVAKNTIINQGIKKREEEMPVYQNDEDDNEKLKDFSEVMFNNESSPSPETEYLRSLVWTELKAALDELPPEQREIFELTELDNIPIKEIAQTLDVPVNTLLSRKHYAVLHLRKRLKELYYDVIYS
ncbi:MAG: sigma-70 family RNA polymerase sigma factor [Candidatus Azobacteroides sp.]|nr:sigma-70 family RNA polymerase sigma factor [Candidatus Azobacteroides sp.]